MVKEGREGGIAHIDRVKIVTHKDKIEALDKEERRYSKG
jgi:hypothetical protein